MEVLGRAIPNLQNAIASGLESVTAGIVESKKASGVAALSIAQDSFSFEQIGTTGSADLPAVSETAEYPDPNQYFRQFSDIASDSPVSSLPISKTLSDPNFNAPKSLQTFSNGSGSMVDNMLQTFRNNSGSMADDLVKLVNRFVFHNPASSLSPGTMIGNLDKQGFPEGVGDQNGSSLDTKGMDQVIEMMSRGTYSAQDRSGRDTADATALGDVSYRAVDRFGRDQRDGASASSPMVDSALKLHNAMEYAKEEYRNEQIDNLNKKDRKEMEDKSKELNPDPSYSAQDRFDRDQRDGSSLEGAAVAGSSDAASNRSIIVVGGKSDDRSIIVVGGKSDDRSIIVVGGKTSGT